MACVQRIRQEGPEQLVQLVLLNLGEEVDYGEYISKTPREMLAILRSMDA